MCAIYRLTLEVIIKKKYSLSSTCSLDFSFTDAKCGREDKFCISAKHASSPGIVAWQCYFTSVAGTLRSFANKHTCTDVVIAKHSPQNYSYSFLGTADKHINPVLG